MDYQALFDKVLATADAEAYLTPVDQVDERYKRALEQIQTALRAPDFDAEATRALTHQLYETGQLDDVHLCSALHVIAASPKVGNLAKAARWADKQEAAARQLGGPNLQTHLASVDRHRGVVAFQSHDYQLALDHFTKALEKQRSAENLGNILCTLLRMGDVSQAVSLYQTIQTAFASNLVQELDILVQSDPDLIALRIR